MNFGNPVAPQAVREIAFSIVDACNNGQGAGPGSGNFTVGQQFSVLRQVSLVGVRFYYPDNVSRSVKVSVWDNSNALQLTKTVTFAAQGIQQILFNSIWAIPLSQTYKTLTVGVYLGSSNYIAGPVKSGLGLTPPLIMGPDFGVVDFGTFIAGDAQPTSTDTQAHPVEPIIVGP